MTKVLFFVLSIIVTKLTIGQVSDFKNESDAKLYFERNVGLLDPIEGIWSVSEASDWYYKGKKINNYTNDNSGKIAIVKDKIGQYKTIKLSGDEYDVFSFEATSLSTVFLTQIYFTIGNRTLTQNCNASLIREKEIIFDTKYNRDITDYIITEAFENSHLETATKNNLHEFEVYNKFNLLKTYPNEFTYVAKKTISSGTGFAIANSGYIVTNYHVVENAKTIKVKGVNGDFNTSLNASIELKDKNNDLAIIKLENGARISGTIPFVVSNKADVVGSDVFSLGYPLRATMGDEVKLTNGIISANSGYQGDITKYQISVPVQPGNSGGPLINSQGNLVAVVNAKHLETENVSYAVKSIYLLSLLASLNENIAFTQTNTLVGKTLSQQVQLVKKFVYIIEVEY
jgi:S1-C subfamily serine protease